METLFEGKPLVLTAFRLAIIAFIGLSVVNLYLSIKVNRALLAKSKESQ
jgi:membrane protein implicated in regulation of membrane protease activity